jgi:hypothetical protein
MRQILLLSLLLLLSRVQVASQAFNPGCQLKGQLKTLAENRPIDSSCPRSGAGSPKSQAQNNAKNNFCASNNPVEITIAKLRTLDSKTQAALKAAHIPFGHPTSIPPDRTRLEQGFAVGSQTFKEGMAVLIRVFVLEGHYSNVGSGEAVNCNGSKQPNNDIHIALGQAPGIQECESVTAEISPHLRPTSWANFPDYAFTHPVMFVGNLFYDASHTPSCTVHPFRSSSWEIHPVYSIFVCKNATLAACPASDTSKWTAFDKWVDLPDDEGDDHHMRWQPNSLSAFPAIRSFASFEMTGL